MNWGRGLLRAWAVIFVCVHVSSRGRLVVAGPCGVCVLRLCVFRLVLNNDPGGMFALW